MKSIIIVGLALLSLLVKSGNAAIIGTNVPARPLTRERIASLPPEQQPAWLEYLTRSEAQKRADQAGLLAELKQLGHQNPTVPPAGHSASDLKLDLPAAWYGSAEARQIADNVVTYQTPGGGWSKNLNMSKQPRALGEAYGTDDNNRYPAPGDFDQARDLKWHYIATFDNDATIKQLEFLAKVIAATGPGTNAWTAAFLRGLDYVFHSQYPNGGWPQVWPLEGGYHDAITMNDDAFLNVLTLTRDVAQGRAEFAWVPATTRAQAAQSYQHGMDCLLAAQIRDRSGHLTVWCQQHDELDLTPASARNYEMPSAATAESANITLFLMLLPQPDARQQAAIRAAVAWFAATKIMDQAYKSTGAAGRQLIDAPGNGPIWARYYDLTTNQPIFGDRDKTIHDHVNELSKERRNGYGWYRDTPKRVLEHFKRWNEAHPA